MIRIIIFTILFTINNFFLYSKNEILLDTLSLQISNDVKYEISDKEFYNGKNKICRINMFVDINNVNRKYEGVFLRFDFFVKGDMEELKKYYILNNEKDVDSFNLLINLLNENEKKIIKSYYVYNKQGGYYVLKKNTPKEVKEKIIDYEFRKKIEKNDDDHEFINLIDFYNESEKYEEKTEFINKNQLKIKRLYTLMGSDISEDILFYYIDIYDNSLFSKCLIWVINIGPDMLKNGEINNKSPKFVFFDNLIDGIKLINSEIINNYKSTANLRIRESADTNAKIIVTIPQGSKIEVLEKGKADTINNIKGNWVKVKTEDGKIGWCFDGYLVHTE